MKIFLIIALSFISILGYSQATQGTKVTAPIVPNDSSDVYSTHDETFGRGGYRSVKTIAERDAIKIALRKEGMLVKVLADDKTYTLKGGISNTNWQIFLNIDSINNLKVSQRLLIQALPAPYAVTFPFLLEDSEGYTRAAVSSKGMIIAGRQHDPTVNVDALTVIGAKNQVSGVDGIAIGTNVKAVSDSSMGIGKNLTNTRAGSVQVGYKNNNVSFDKDSARVSGNWPFLKKSWFPYTKTLDSVWIWTTKRGKSFAIGMDPGFPGYAYCWGNNVYPDMNFSFMGKNFSSGSYSIGTVTSTYMELGSYNYLNNNHRIKISNSEIVFSNHNEDGIKLKNKSLQYLAHATVQNNLWITDKQYVDSLANGKQNSLGTGSTSQYLRGDLTWQSIPGSTWGSITGTLSSQTDLQNALNNKQNSLGTGTTSDYLRGDLTWQPFSEVTDKYMLKFSGQALQDTVRSTRFFDGIQSTAGGGTTWNYHTVSFYSPNWSGGFQLQADVHSDTYLIRRIKDNVNQTWKQLALIDDITSANTTTTNYVDSQITTTTNYVNTKTATIGYTFTETRDDVTDGNFNLTKFGNVVNLNFSFSRTAAENDNVLVYLGTVPVGARPTSVTYGTINPGNGTESGQIKIETDGVVSIHCGIANQTWYGNLTWIIINN